MQSLVDMSNLDTISLTRIIYRAMLGRQMSDAEIEAAKNRFGEGSFDPRLLGSEIERSEEFHSLHREVAAERLFPTSTVVVGSGPMGHELLLDLRQFHVGFAIAMGHFELGETAFVQAHVQRGMHVLDVGANIGYFTTIFAALVGSAGSVHAFEPVSESRRRLTAAVHRNKLEHIIQIHKAAASAEAGLLEMSYETNSLNMGGINLITEGPAPHDIFERVETVRIDDVIGGLPVDFIKMDVEGAEGLALAGARDVILRNRPVMMVEFNPEQLARVSRTTPAIVLKTIIDMGYTARRIEYDGSLTPTTTVDDHSVVNLAFFPNP